MQPNFQLMNQAVKQIRDRVEKEFNDGNIFTRKDTTQEQYEPCCQATELSENPGFPNVRPCLIAKEVKNLTLCENQF